MDERVFWIGIRRQMLGIARAIERRPDGARDPFWNALREHFEAIASTIQSRFGE